MAAGLPTAHRSHVSRSILILAKSIVGVFFFSTFVQSVPENRTISVVAPFVTTKSSHEDGHRICTAYLMRMAALRVVLGALERVVAL